MQTTIPAGMPFEDAERLGRVRDELFTGRDDAHVTRKMDKRLAKLEGRGEQLVSRRVIAPEDAPSEIARLAEQAAAAHNKGQKRRLKKAAQKLLAGL